MMISLSIKVGEVWHPLGSRVCNPGNLFFNLKGVQYRGDTAWCTVVCVWVCVWVCVCQWPGVCVVTVCVCVTLCV